MGEWILGPKPYIVPNNSPHNPFPHSLLSTRESCLLFLRFGAFSVRVLWLFEILEPKFAVSGSGFGFQASKARGLQNGVFISSGSFHQRL